jgi:putative acetyltransferase
MSETIRLTVEDANAPLARMLFHELDTDLVARYPGTGAHELAETAGALIATVFLVAWHSEEPIGCAALLDRGSGVAELKRMFVRTRFRNQGIARQLLTAIERQARDLGYTEIRLRTGSRQPEAVGLYESSGYAPSQHGDDPDSVYYVKSLVTG